MQDTLSKLQTAEGRVGLVISFFLFYMVVFFALGHEAMELWPEFIAIVLSLAAAVRLVRINRDAIQLFFLLLSIALLADAFNVLFLQTGDPEITQSIINGLAGNSSDHKLSISFPFYGLYLFLWNIAWAVLTYRMASQLRQGSTYMLVAALLSVGIVFLIIYQLDNFDFNFQQTEERFRFLFLIMELTGVLLGLLCVLMGIGRAMLIMVIGFTLGAASDIIAVFNALPLLLEETGPHFVYRLSESLNSEYMEPLWTLGRTIILLGLLLLPIGGFSEGSVRINTRFYDANQHRQSGLSVYLLIFWLLSVNIAIVGVLMFSHAPHLLTMFLVLFSALCVILMAAMTSRFDEMVAYLEARITDLFQKELDTALLQKETPRTRRWLAVTSLDRVLRATKKAATAVRSEVIFLGPERLNRPPGNVNRKGSINCFLVMPFNTPWSDTVSNIMRDVCRATSVRAVRGDDLNGPSNILDDIWNGIIEADFVIADITGNNANVFYELGMAHALGKPVLILVQNTEATPFDVTTNRMLQYDIQQLDELKARLTVAVEDTLKKYEFRTPE